MDDALGSVRGLTDSSGVLTGSADYDAFGAIRSQNGASLPLGFSGELTDPTTGFLDLRARDLDPELGRFLSRDTVSPNAPGSQGYNPYAYVANNPTTWTDPSGQSISSGVAETFVLLQAAFRIRQYTLAIIEGITLIDIGSPLQKIGGGLELIFTAVACALDAPCRALADFSAKVIDTYGSMAPAGPWTLPIQSMRFAIHHFPTIPTSVLCSINKAGIVYGATRNIPTSVGVNGSDSDGDVLDPESCNEGSTGSEQVDSTIRIYSPTAKHDPVYSRNPKGTPMDLDYATAQQVLIEGYQKGKTVWGYHNGKIYRFFTEGANKYHGFPYPGGDARSNILDSFEPTE